MRDGRCVRCGATTVRAARNGIELGERPSQTYFRPHLDPGFRGIVRSHPGEVWNLLCTTCGHLEWAIYDPATIAYINEHWMPVPVQPASPPPPSTG